MMYNYPFYNNFPFHNRYPKYNYYGNNSYNSINNKNYNEQKKEAEPQKHKTYEIEKKEEKQNNDDDQVFEIFGIKLHFDDILLVCLIFFLYKEGVKDQSLYISLVLLLLS